MIARRATERSVPDACLCNPPLSPDAAELCRNKKAATCSTAMASPRTAVNWEWEYETGAAAH